MKRLLALIIALSCLLLCGCRQNSPNTAAEEAKLTELLTEIDNTMQPGTAGSSLKAAYLAAMLLDWSRDTTLSEATIEEVTKTAMANARTDHPVSFTEKMQSVHSAYELLMTADGEDILSDCGYSGGGYPWSEEDTAALKCVMETVNCN